MSCYRMPYDAVVRRGVAPDNVIVNTAVMAR